MNHRVFKIQTKLMTRPTRGFLLTEIIRKGEGNYINASLTMTLCDKFCEQSVILELQRNDKSVLK